jgi:hypothetical protein
VMIATDLARVVIALAFLLVTGADTLWIAYLGTILLSGFGAFFEGAKNAATPNLTGKEGLLAGTALMFSTRFLLMAIGSALGGAAAAVFGYKVAFVINALSFAVSAYTVWLIPEIAVKQPETEEPGRGRVEELARESFWYELKEGFRYTIANRFAATILIMNVIWAAGGGGINVIFERLGGVHFAALEGWNPDAAVGVLWFAAGLGLTIGMLIAHRTSVYLDRRKRHRSFIGWILDRRDHAVAPDAGVDRVGFAGDRGRRIRSTGNDVPAKSAGQYPRPNLNTRPRRRADRIWLVELRRERADVLHHPPDSDGNIRHYVRSIRRRVVCSAGKEATRPKIGDKIRETGDGRSVLDNELPESRRQTSRPDTCLTSPIYRLLSFIFQLSRDNDSPCSGEFRKILCVDSIDATDL